MCNKHVCCVCRFLGAPGLRVALEKEKVDADERLAHVRAQLQAAVEEYRYSQMQASGGAPSAPLALGVTTVGNLTALGVGEDSWKEEVDRLGKVVANARTQLRMHKSAVERLEDVLLVVRQGASGLAAMLDPFTDLLGVVNPKLRNGMHGFALASADTGTGVNSGRDLQTSVLSGEGVSVTSSGSPRLLDVRKQGNETLRYLSNVQSAVSAMISMLSGSTKRALREGIEAALTAETAASKTQADDAGTFLTSVGLGSHEATQQALAAALKCSDVELLDALEKLAGAEFDPAQLAAQVTQTAAASATGIGPSAGQSSGKAGIVNQETVSAVACALDHRAAMLRDLSVASIRMISSGASGIALPDETVESPVRGGSRSSSRQAFSTPSLMGVARQTLSGSAATDSPLYGGKPGPSASAGYEGVDLSTLAAPPALPSPECDVTLASVTVHQGLLPGAFQYGEGSLDTYMPAISEPSFHVNNIRVEPQPRLDPTTGDLVGDKEQEEHKRSGSVSPFRGGGRPAASPSARTHGTDTGAFDALAAINSRLLSLGADNDDSVGGDDDDESPFMASAALRAGLPHRQDSIRAALESVAGVRPVTVTGRRGVGTGTSGAGLFGASDKDSVHSASRGSLSGGPTSATALRVVAAANKGKLGASGLLPLSTVPAVTLQHGGTSGGVLGFGPLGATSEADEDKIMDRAAVKRRAGEARHHPSIGPLGSSSGSGSGAQGEGGHGGMGGAPASPIPLGAHRKASSQAGGVTELSLLTKRPKLA